MQLQHLRGIDEIAAAEWDALAPAGNPFVGHAFLSTLEDSGSATGDTGWQPLHAVLRDGDRAVAAAPLYAKGHSYGEYVFDHGWADAYRRVGGRYYPKLQVAVPFTPVPGPRLLGDPRHRATLAAALVKSTDQVGLSSLHVTFCTPEEAEALRAAGCLVRRGIQYHWANRGYATFDDFLAELRSAKRKMIRRERREVGDAGIEMEVLHGPNLTRRHMEEFFPFYLATVDKRWGSAYLTAEFFSTLADRLAERVVLVTARRNGELVAAALNLLGADTLYGRLWGCLEDFRFLHFEACYYQAIEFAIAHGLARVEAGAQGTHKLQRGYAPVWTWSAHWIRDPGLREGVRRFLIQETRELESHIGHLAEMLPYREAGISVIQSTSREACVAPESSAAETTA
jgi:predicted N-acyltransferase